MKMALHMYFAYVLKYRGFDTIEINEVCYHAGVASVLTGRLSGGVSLTWGVRLGPMSTGTRLRSTIPSA